MRYIGQSGTFHFISFHWFRMHHASYRAKKRKRINRNIWYYLLFGIVGVLLFRCEIPIISLDVPVVFTIRWFDVNADASLCSGNIERVFRLTLPLLYRFTLCLVPLVIIADAAIDTSAFTMNNSILVISIWLPGDAWIIFAFSPKFRCGSNAIVDGDCVTCIWWIWLFIWNTLLRVARLLCDSSLVGVRMCILSSKFVVDISLLLDENAWLRRWSDCDALLLCKKLVLPPPNTIVELFTCNFGTFCRSYGIRLCNFFEHSRIHLDLWYGQ